MTRHSTHLSCNHDSCHLSCSLLLFYLTIHVPALPGMPRRTLSGGVCRWWHGKPRRMTCLSHTASHALMTPRMRGAGLLPSRPQTRQLSPPHLTAPGTCTHTQGQDETAQGGYAHVAMLQPDVYHVEQCAVSDFLVHRSSLSPSLLSLSRAHKNHTLALCSFSFCLSLLFSLFLPLSLNPLALSRAISLLFSLSPWFSLAVALSCFCSCALSHSLPLDVCVGMEKCGPIAHAPPPDTQ